MIYNRYCDMEKETMPQTVPSVGLSPPCAYSFSADSFDLSLLSPDGEVPVSPPSLRHLMSLYGDPTTSPEPMFNTPEEDDYAKSLEKSKEPVVNDYDFPTTILEGNIAQLKSPALKTESLQQQINQYQNSILFEQFHNFGYQSPIYSTPSPSSDETATIPTFNIQPCSPYDQQTNNAYGAQNSYNPTFLIVKEEPQNNLLSPQYSPYSPAASVCTSYSNNSSPHYVQPLSPSRYTPRPVKDEAAIDIEELLKQNQILQESVYSKNNTASENRTLLVPKQEETSKPKDYQLLREVLQDTSFQKKFNLRPINFDSLTAGFVHGGLNLKMEEPEGLESSGDNLMSSCSSALAREKIEPVLSLAIEQMRKDVDNTCTALGISQDPLQWSVEDVKAWLLWTLRQYSLPLVPVEYFNMDGTRLAALTEQDFVQRAPQAGSTLYAQLEIWKAARQETSGIGSSSSWGTSHHTSATSNASSNEENSDDEEEDVSAKDSQPAAGSGGKAPSSKQGGSHIHLWQFLKELLASPQLHGSAIRWLDRSKGVFKIEDSVRVARLWGKRKNRPAMNYDKLSRSIRQYYKKGIMKKTERSQRLVYQFCHPYSL